MPLTRTIRLRDMRRVAVYWNPLLGVRYIIRATPGAGASIDLRNPPDLSAIRFALVARFHTHPNPPIDENGRMWLQGPSAPDIMNAALAGLPEFIRAANVIYAYGVYRRGGYINRRDDGTWEFAGPWGFPGPNVPQLPGC